MRKFENQVCREQGEGERERESRESDRQRGEGELAEGEWAEGGQAEGETEPSHVTCNQNGIADSGSLRDGEMPRIRVGKHSQSEEEVVEETDYRICSQIWVVEASRNN